MLLMLKTQPASSTRWSWSAGLGSRKQKTFQKVSGLFGIVGLAWDPWASGMCKLLEEGKWDTSGLKRKRITLYLGRGLIPAILSCPGRWMFLLDWMMRRLWNEGGKRRPLLKPKLIPKGKLKQITRKTALKSLFYLSIFSLIQLPAGGA